MKPRRDEHQQQRPRVAALQASEQRVRNVSAVELTERQQVEGGREEAEPRREPGRVQEDVAALRQGRVEQAGDEVEGERLAEDHVAARRKLGNRLRQRYSEEEDGQAHDEPGQRPGGTDVEQLPLRARSRSGCG